MDLPTFKYHPDPIATGSIEALGTRCVCCGEDRGYIYVGPVYAVADLDDAICPWCIASGLAHEKYNASFSDTGSVGGGRYFTGEAVTEGIKEAIAYRTSDSVVGSKNDGLPIAVTPVHSSALRIKKTSRHTTALSYVTVFVRILGCPNNSFNNILTDLIETTGQPLTSFNAFIVVSI